jgi:hypothetical protein
MQNVRSWAAAITQARRDKLGPPSAHSCLVTVAAAPMSITCIICAFNEAERMDTLLDAVIVHPNVAEIIVVNDGSTDGTEAILRRRTDISIVSYATNRGKTYSLSRGVALAKYEAHDRPGAQARVRRAHPNVFGGQPLKGPVGKLTGKGVPRPGMEPTQPQPPDGSPHVQPEMHPRFLKQRVALPNPEGSPRLLRYSLSKSRAAEKRPRGCSMAACWPNSTPNGR